MEGSIWFGKLQFLLVYRVYIGFRVMFSIFKVYWKAGIYSFIYLFRLRKLIIFLNVFFLDIGKFLKYELCQIKLKRGFLW